MKMWRNCKPGSGETGLGSGQKSAPARWGAGAVGVGMGVLGGAG